jgi:excinuclease ABC subunit C
MDIKKLKELVAKTPDTPGVYRFQAGKEDIYIGKASSIKRRLASYTKTTDSRIQKMIATAEKLVHIETESDIEALILESQLIKQHLPQFNIMLRDDKQYFFVAFTQDEYPRLYLTHQPQKSGAPITSHKFRRMPVKEYIGPFTDGAALKSTLKYLRNIFPYCTCSQKHHNFCLNYHIGKCIGFCCLKGDQPAEQHDRYMANIKAIRDILTGRRSSLVKELKKEMETAGKKHDFDAAIVLRNKLERLERVFYNAQVIKNSEILKSYNSALPALLKSKKPIIRIEGYDISNIQGNHATGSMVTFIQGEADKNFYRKFNIKTVRGSNDTAMLREVIERRFNHPEWPFPDLILIDGGKGQVSSALSVLKDMGISIPLVGLSKDDRHMGHQLIIPGRKHPLSLTKLGLTDKNLLLAVDAEAHRFAISYYRKLHRKSFQ